MIQEMAKIYMKQLEESKTKRTAEVRSEVKPISCIPTGNDRASTAICHQYQVAIQSAYNSLQLALFIKYVLLNGI